MSPVTSQEILDAFNSDPRATADGPIMFRVLPQFLGGLTKVLADRLNAPVTAGGLAQAKREFIAYMLETGLIEAVMTAADSPTAQLLVNYFSQISRELIPMATTPETVLRQAGVTERAFMLSHVVGLNPNMRQRYEEGSLTYADLIRHQPCAVVVMAAGAS